MINKNSNVNSPFRCSCGEFYVPPRNYVSYVILCELNVYTKKSFKDLLYDLTRYTSIYSKASKNPVTLRRALQYNLSTLVRKGLIVHTPRKGYKLNV